MLRREGAAKTRSPWFLTSGMKARDADFFRPLAVIVESKPHAAIVKLRVLPMSDRHLGGALNPLLICHANGLGVCVAGVVEVAQRHA
jgi:hypothetical protein